jgi:hypothetical protein
VPWIWEVSKLNIKLTVLLAFMAACVFIGSCAPLATNGKSAGQSSVAHRSIRNWVTCDGLSDDTAGVAKAFAAAAHASFTLVVDCPVRLQIGMDISRSIFVDDDTAIEFTGAGKLTLDNVFIPAFVIANSHNITLTNWNVQYEAGLPVNMIVEGYSTGGKIVPGKQPSGAFSEERITPWLAAHRGIKFDASQGHITSLWTGSTPMCAIFFITGDSSHLAITGAQVRVPASAGGERFVPVVFSLNPNFKSNQAITAKTPITAQFVAVPHDLSFSGITLDGTYMGWVGTLQNAVFEDVRSYRYGDLQDAKGENPGGVGKWFAPPHLFYFTRYAATQDLALSNRNIRIHDVVDEGLRIGRARDAEGEAPSGNALSLKIGCINCTVDSYKSARPDGFLDVLSSDGLTISNVQATYDSAFLNHVYSGWRFPQAPYNNVTFENISLTDKADATRQVPISHLSWGSIQGIVMRNVQVELNRWEAPVNDPFPKIVGQRIDLSLSYSMRLNGSRTIRSQKGPIELTLGAVPATFRAGGTTTLTWFSREASACVGSGAWSGTVPLAGSRSITLAAAGDVEFRLECRGGDNVASGTLRVAVLQ